MVTDTQKSADNGSLIKRLFDVGAHFGFSKSRRHPTAMPYLFGSKQGTDIFDLEKTSVLLTDAAEYVRSLGALGKQVLFVGTKEEVRELVKESALAVDMPYVVNRWIGGILTNASEIHKRIGRLAAYRQQKESGELERKYTKKERVVIGREIDKLDFNFGGITAMERAPAALIVVDPRHDVIAVKEANDMNIPVVAIMSSDCNADMVTKPIFVNDAHRASVTLALGELVAAYRAGRAAYVPPPTPDRARPRMQSTPRA
jgi:small subunit ribosomal protein S2